jgi:hypothetical protein
MGEVQVGRSALKVEPKAVRHGVTFKHGFSALQPPGRVVNLATVDASGAVGAVQAVAFGVALEEPTSIGGGGDLREVDGADFQPRDDEAGDELESACVEFEVGL